MEVLIHLFIITINTRARYKIKIVYRKQYRRCANIINNKRLLKCQKKEVFHTEALLGIVMSEK